jgi:putative peptidoglycan lipid II flippase
VRRARIPIRWRFDVKNAAVRTVLRLSGWTFGYVATNAIVVGILIALARRSDESGTTLAYSLAYQFFQLPYGVLAVSVITAFLPELSRLAAAGDLRAFGERFLTALRLMVLLVAPAALGMIILARPIIAVFFEHRAFTDDVSTLTATTLVAFTVGLPSFSLFLLAVRAFYAQKDTRTPFWLNLAESALTLALAAPLWRALGGPGLALAFALGYLVFGFVALAALHRRVGGLPWAGNVAALLRIALAATAMAVVVVALAHLVGDNTGTGAIVRMALGVAVGAAVYLGACAALRVPDVRQAARLIGRSR